MSVKKRFEEIATRLIETGCALLISLKISYLAGTEKERINEHNTHRASPKRGL
jgi:hypothetical protein